MVNNISKYDLLLFDAANTIMHKPLLWERFHSVLKEFGYEVSALELRKKHKLVSEIFKFPDQTSNDFYNQFNAEVLLSLGIIPDTSLLDRIFSACKYLPWEVFRDVPSINEICCKKAILSNFNSSLREKINMLFGSLFSEIIISEEEQVAKPELLFYKKALDKLGVPPHRILYIGDSLKLDIIPATILGLDAWLIDRDNVYPNFQKRITSFSQIKSILTL